MSAKLAKALAKGRVKIRKRIAGEVGIHFQDGRVHAVNHSGVEDLTSRTDIKVDDLKKSNLKDLINKKLIDIV